MKLSIDTLALFIKNTLFTIIIPGAVIALGPYLLIPQGPWPFELELGNLRLIGLIPLAVGVSIYLSTILDFARIGRGTPAPFDPPRTLILKGLYKHVRNPMYVGVLSVLLGEMIYFEAAILLVYVAFVFLALHTFVILYEEPTLKRTLVSPIMNT